MDGLTCAVWVLYQSLERMRVFVPDFQPPKPEEHTPEYDMFFKRVWGTGIFEFKHEKCMKDFLKSYDKETTAFQDVMLKCIGIGLSHVRQGDKGQLYHHSTTTYEKISKFIIFTNPAFVHFSTEKTIEFA